MSTILPASSRRTRRRGWKRFAARSKKRPARRSPSLQCTRWREKASRIMRWICTSNSEWEASAIVVACCSWLLRTSTNIASKLGTDWSRLSTMRVPETRAARWFQCCARKATAPRSSPRPGCWRNTLPMIAVLRYRASPQLGRAGRKGNRSQLVSGAYFSSSGLSSRLREPGGEPDAAEEAAVAGGGSGRCLVGWVVVGEAAALVAAPAGTLVVEDLAASAEAAAEAVGRPGTGRGWRTEWGAQ